MNKKSITSNYIYNLIYQLISLISPIVLIPYLTRILGTEKLGIFTYTSAIIIIFYSIASLGINLYGQREIAYLQDEKNKRSALFWELIIIRITSTVILLITLIAFITLTNRYKEFYIFFIPYLVANIFDISWLYQGMEDFKNVSIRNIIVKAFYIVSTLLIVKTEFDFVKYILIFSIQMLLTTLMFWINLKKYVCLVKLKEIKIKRHFKHVFIFFVPQLATTLYTMIDKTMIGIIVPNIDSVYFYEQASYIVKTILVLITTVGTIMISNIAYEFKNNSYDSIKYKIKEIINFVWLLGCPLTFGVCAVVNNAVPWFYGGEYNDIVLLTYYISPLIIIIGLNNILGYQLLIPIKRQNRYVFAVIIGASFNFIANIIFINVFGVVGAAIASVLSELLVLFIEARYIRDIVKVRDLIKNNLRYILYGVIMFVLVFFVGIKMGPSLMTCIIQVLIGVIVYLLFLVITKDKFFLEHIVYYLKEKIGVKR